MPPRFVPNAAPRCPRCNKMVYQAEQVIGPNGAPYHKACYTCLECNKRLDSSSLAEHNGQAYCKTCHAKKWGPTGYGYAGGAAFLQPEEPGNEFKSSLQRVPATHTGGSAHSGSGSAGSPAGYRVTPSSPAAVSSHNTGGSTSSQTSSPTFARLQKSLDETEEQERARLTPVNATLKKRNSLDMIREQAEASRRAYDELHASRVAAQRQGSLTPTSTGTASPRQLTGNGSTSNLSVAGSDTSSVYGSTVANAGSPTPSFSSLSSATSAQPTTPNSTSSLSTGSTPATKTIYFNQPYRSGRIGGGNSSSSGNSNYNNASTATPASSAGTTFTQPIRSQRTPEKKMEEDDPEVVLAKSRQALSFQTGVSGSASSENPSAHSFKSSPSAKNVTPPSTAATKPVDESYMEFVPFRLVAKTDERGGSNKTHSFEQPQPRQDQDDDDWDPEDVKDNKRKQAVLQQFYDSKADKLYAIQQQQQTESSRPSFVAASTRKEPSGAAPATVSQLVNDAKKLTLERRYQAAVRDPAPIDPIPPPTVSPQPIQKQPEPQIQQQAAEPKTKSSTGPVDDDEWDEDPTPNTYGSKDLGMNYVGRNWS
ncbi:hypothetical protein BGZ73_001231 [Actinomortierella ambigua]|nr:hypothetical protein BGZ73_001231 [Actinomortierella ambigua]